MICQWLNGKDMEENGWAHTEGTVPAVCGERRGMKRILVWISGSWFGSELGTSQDAKHFILIAPAVLSFNQLNVLLLTGY
jgi:hypothetical protein